MKDNKMYFLAEIIQDLAQTGKTDFRHLKRRSGSFGTRLCLILRSKMVSVTGSGELSVGAVSTQLSTLISISVAPS